MKLLRLLGLKITTKTKGVVIGKPLEEIEILGLLYKTGKHFVDISISQEKIAEFQHLIDL